MSASVVMNCSEESLPAAAYFMSGFIIVIGIAKQSSAAITDFVTVLIIMIDPVGKDALAAEDLLHWIIAPFRKDGGRSEPCPICKSLSPFLLLRVPD